MMSARVQQRTRGSKWMKIRARILRRDRHGAEFEQLTGFDEEAASRLVILGVDGTESDRQARHQTGFDEVVCLVDVSGSAGRGDRRLNLRAGRCDRHFVDGVVGIGAAVFERRDVIHDDGLAHNVLFSAQHADRIPANADAAVQSIKTHDKSRVGAPVVRLSAPIIKESDMTIAQQLAALAKKRADHLARQKALMDGAAADGARTLNENEATEYDQIGLELKSLDNLSVAGAVWIMSETTALSLSLMLNALGQPEFPGLTMAGGTFFGLPAILSQTVGDNIVLAKASEILFADDGGVTLDVSREASLQMDSAPVAGATELVSLWQNGFIAMKAERFINWKRRRVEGVQYISGAAYGDAAQAG